MRQFIRHLIDVPLAVGFGVSEPSAGYHTHDICQGGVAFRSAGAVPAGQEVEIGIDFVQPPFQARGRVVWCRPHPVNGYELGVRFDDAEEAFRARMVAQLCAIEDYRCAVLRTEGRELSMDQAAAEWIERHAADFPAGH